MSENKLKLEFAPGCFDDFEGTQEELDSLVNEIQTMFDTMDTSEFGELTDEKVVVKHLYTMTDDKVEALKNADSEESLVPTSRKTLH